MFETLRNKLPTPNGVGDEPTAEQAIEALIDALPDQDPVLVAYQSLQGDRDQLVALSAALKTSKDPQSLIQFANADGALEACLPKSVSLESITTGPTATATAEKIDNFVATAVDPALEKFFGEGFWSKFFGFLAVMALISTVQFVFMGAAAAAVVALCWAAAWAFFSDVADKGGATEAVQGEGTPKTATVLRARDLMGFVKSIGAATAALAALSKMALPKTAAEAKTFSKAVASNAKALSGIGLLVAADGTVTVGDFPKPASGTGQQLGYGKDTMKQVGDAIKAMQSSSKSDLDQIKSGVKKMDADGKTFFKGDASAEDKAAVKAAAVIHKNVLTAGLRRLPKALKYAFSSTKASIGAFYKVPKK